MRAAWITWANEMKECSTLPDIIEYAPLVFDAENSEAGDPSIEAWCEPWGTAGLPSADSPYGSITDTFVPQKPKEQKDRKLRVDFDDHAPTVAEIFDTVGGNSFKGFQLFRNSHAFGMWTVTAPRSKPVDASTTQEPHRVNVVPPKKGFHYVADVLILDNMRRFVVRGLNVA